MSDEMDVLFDHRLRNALHGTSLPAAPASLRSAVEDLPRATGGTAAPSLPRRTAWAALAAGLATVAVLGWAAMSGQNGVGPVGPTPSPSPSGSSSPGPTQSTSETLDVLQVSQLLDARADGTLGGEPVGVFGFFSDFRSATDLQGNAIDPCPPPSPVLELGCLDIRQGIAENDALIGGFSEEGMWTPDVAAGAVLHPYWPDTLRDDPEAAGLFAAAPEDPHVPRVPSLVVVAGHFEDPRAAACPADASPPCVDRFVVDDVLSFEDQFARASATPAASATPFPFDSPPPPPSWMANCSRPRSDTGPEPGDPTDFGYAREDWIPKAEMPFEFLGSEALPDVVYYAEVEPDIPLGTWQEPVTGTADDYRWWGTSVCVMTEANGILYTWVPGSTYKLYRDGRRVDGGDPFDPLPSSSPPP